MFDKMKIALIVFSSIIATDLSWGASKDPYYAEAIKQAENVFSKYVTSCGDSNYAMVGSSSFLEFKQGVPKVKLIGNYPLSESDKLNGNLWHGKFSVYLGKSYRRNSSNDAWYPWSVAQSAGFDLKLLNKEWKVDGDISVYAGAWFDFKNGITCDDIPLTLR